MIRLKQITTFSVVIGILAISICALAGPIPDTGQTQSYTDTFGEDSDYTINPPSYTKLNAQGNALPDSASSWSMVKDNVTGLIWENKTDDGSIHDKNNKYNWDDAQSVFIKELNDKNFGGFSDWRLPTVKELSFIVNSGTYDPAIDTNYFPNLMSFSDWPLEYWSSITNDYYSDCGIAGAWYVGFVDGDVYAILKSYVCAVRAVRGGQSGSLDDLVINGDGTVTDTSTGLIWQQQTAGEMTWEEAIKYCEGLSLGGYNDWRLPNRNELQSLVDYTRWHPAIDTTAFPCDMSSMSSYYYWSSTNLAYYTGGAWCVSFGYGNIYGGNKSSSYDVRAVRSVPGGRFTLWPGLNLLPLPVDDLESYPTVSSLWDYIVSQDVQLAKIQTVYPSSQWLTFWKSSSKTSHGEDFSVSPYTVWLVYTNQTKAKEINLDLLPTSFTSSSFKPSLSLGLNLVNLCSVPDQNWLENLFEMFNQEDKDLTCIVDYDSLKGKWQANYRLFGQVAGSEYVMKKGGHLLYVQEADKNNRK